MRLAHRVLAAVCLAVAALAAPAPLAADADLPPEPRPGAIHAVPLYGELLRPWDAPHDNPFAPGHRGIDVAASMGSAVRASADGVVGFAGTVAGNRSVTIDHGEGLWTTYSFLGDILVRQGDEVVRADVVGTVGRGHPSSELPPHVHLSARQDGAYFDPVVLYAGDRVDDLISLTR